MLGRWSRGERTTLGYLQNWLYQRIGYERNAMPEKSAQKIFRAADQILTGSGRRANAA